MIVVFEGIDACGKDTQVDMLAERAARSEQFGPNVGVLRFPTHDTPSGRVVRGLLTGKYIFEQADPDTTWDESEARGLTIQMLMTADRLPQQAMLREHYRNPNTLVVLSRYTMSGLVYGQADGLAREWLVDVNAPLVQPDLYVWLDITVEESHRRRPERRDLYERDDSKMRRVRELYESEMTRLNRDAWIRVLGTGTKDDVAALIWNFVNHKASTLKK